MLKERFKEAKNRMDDSINKLRADLATIRTGRASLSIFEGIKVDYYGVPTPIDQVAGLATPEANLITVQPWETSMVPVISKAILAANLGLTPNSDGTIIRITVPPLTEERRKEYAKLCHKHGEATKTAIRNIRRDVNDKLKKMEKSKEISQDEMHSGFDEIQRITDDGTSMVDDLVKAKEKDILTL